jgi:hypothetical protein
VRENLATFYTAIEQGWNSGLPEFVRAEFSRYLNCSVLQRGFAHLACQDCGLPRLVAFTCAGRGFCPTCLGRRMNQTTHNLLAHVLPAQPLRQWVLTLPFPLRAPLAYEPGLMTLVARVFEDSLLRWYRQRLAPEDPTAQGGLLTVIQRSSGDMRLNPHLHVLGLDGVFLTGPGGGPVFRALGSLTHISPPATLLPSPASLSRPLRARQTPPQCYSCRHAGRFKSITDSTVSLHGGPRRHMFLRRSS